MGEHKHKKGRVFKHIAGGLLLVMALHYALDEPTRSQLIRAVVERRHLISATPNPLDPWPYPDVTQNAQGLLHDASFELWEEQPYPTLKVWFSSASVAAWDIVKQETKMVQHGRSAVRLEHDGGGHCGNVRQDLPDESIPLLRGHRLKFSAWALSTIPGAPCLHIKINDEPLHEPVGSTACLQDPSGTWQPVTVERTIGPEATRVELIIDIAREAMGKTVAWVYVDNVSLVSSQLPSDPPSTIAVTPALPSASSTRH